MNYAQRIDEIELLNIDMHKDPSKENLEKIFNKVENELADLNHNYNPEVDRTPDRVDLYRKLQFLQGELNKKLGAKFSNEDILSIEAQQKFQTARAAINAMKITDNIRRDIQEENKVRDSISALYLRKGNERSLVSAEHPEVMKLWNAYKHKKIMNIIKYAQVGTRNLKRDEAFRKSLTENAGSTPFKAEDVAAAMNALESRKPIA